MERERRGWHMRSGTNKYVTSNRPNTSPENLLPDSKRFCPSWDRGDMPFPVKTSHVIPTNGEDGGTIADEVGAMRPCQRSGASNAEEFQCCTPLVAGFTLYAVIR